MRYVRAGTVYCLPQRRAGAISIQEEVFMVGHSALELKEE